MFKSKDFEGMMSEYTSLKYSMILNMAAMQNNNYTIKLL